MFDLDEFLHHFERVRERTRRVAACIPAEQVEWTYKAGAFTLGDLVRHIAVTERFIWAETVHNRPVAYARTGASSPTAATRCWRSSIGCTKNRSHSSAR